MANNYFQFKQFTVQQDNCAMKVCTDACLFGAYMAEEQQRHTIFDSLDIGTGTGLLSLMLAQKHNAAIDAVEIDEPAYEQATENIVQANFDVSIHTYNCSISNFFPGSYYDCIISNPPFFEDDLQSTDEKKNAAKHNTGLTLQELLNNVDRLLNNEGIFGVLLPFHRMEYFIAAALEMNLHCYKKILVKQTPMHNYFRSILIFSRNAVTNVQEEIIIKDQEGNYSAEFITLLKDYYLHL